MKTSPKATQLVRLYPEDYKLVMTQARERRTIAAQIITEALNNSK